MDRRRLRFFRSAGIRRVFVKYLLDTTAWLWMVGVSSNLGETTAKTLTNETTELYLSVASAWEIAIKAQIGKLRIPGDADEFIRSRLRLQRIAALPVTLDHALAVSRLPMFHRDPFDRIIVAQALVEGLTVVTSDRELERYPVAVHDART